MRVSFGIAALCAGVLACSVDVSDDGGFGSGATAPGASTGRDEGTSDGSAQTGALDTSGDGDGPSEGDGTASATTDGGSDEGDATSTTATTDTGPDLPGDPLHPDLEVPDDGQVCQTPGSLNECPAVHVCRFHTSEQGLCESCDVCGNLGAPCQSGTDCDILFACFQGRCTNICPLGTQYCGPVDACLDVGHPTHGVCDPFA